jgi:glycosyltransferase involved in cell wall biosynthesis
MKFDVVIPTRWVKETLYTILHCIAKQSLLPQYIILVVNAFWRSHKDIHAMLHEIIPDQIQDFIQVIFVPEEYSGNASYARNLWREHTISPYVYFLDDDNQFWVDFFSSCIGEYNVMKNGLWTDFLYSPTIMWRTTNTVQSKWLKTFHYFVGWPEPVIFSWWKSKFVKRFRMLFPLPNFYYQSPHYTRASMIGGNSLLSAKKLFDAFPFDEDMAFVYEDIDMSYRLTKDKNPLIVSNKVFIHHMERDKTKLEQSFLGTAESAYKKAKNRIMFVKKNGNSWQQFLFFCIWLPITSLMTLLFIVWSWGKNRLHIAGSYIKGTWSWLQTSPKHLYSDL